MTNRFATLRQQNLICHPHSSRNGSNSRNGFNGSGEFNGTSEGN